MKSGPKYEIGQIVRYDLSRYREKYNDLLYITHIRNMGSEGDYASYRYYGKNYYNEFVAVYEYDCAEASLKDYVKWNNREKKE